MLGSLMMLHSGGLGQLRRQFDGDRKVSAQAASHGNIPLQPFNDAHLLKP